MRCDNDGGIFGVVMVTFALAGVTFGVLAHLARAQHWQC